MSVQPTSTEAAGAVAVAQEHQLARIALAAVATKAVLDAWASIDPLNLFAWWWQRGLGARIYVLLSMAQEAAAADANAFVGEVYDVLGYPIQTPSVAPSAFAGIASDGRDLEALLAGAPITALQRSRRGDPPTVVKQAGADYLTAVVRTQVGDAGRAADQVAIATALPTQRRARKVAYGWVRMLNPPSCERCIVLAGQFYKWNQGFQRHPMCDCVHIPAVESIADDLTTNPYEYFKSLTKEQQNEQFGKANAQAIRDGADLNRVLNAATRFNPRTGRTALLIDPNTATYDAQGRRTFAGRRTTSEATTRRGVRGLSGVARPTPWQIYRDAAGNRDEARRLLLRYGYILR